MYAVQSDGSAYANDSVRRVDSARPNTPMIIVIMTPTGMRANSLSGFAKLSRPIDNFVFI
ncbi:hypothetical protein GCM10009060_12960 [Halorubrum trapanicum]